MERADVFGRVGRSGVGTFGVGVCINGGVGVV